MLSTPSAIGLFAAAFALLGWMKIADETLFRFYERRRLRILNGRAEENQEDNSYGRSKASSINKWQFLQMSAAFLSSLMITILLTTSLEISVAISLLITALPFILAKRKAEKLRVERDKAWPVVIDEIVASLQAGQSISESLTSLSATGPEQLHPTFLRINQGLRRGFDLEELLKREMVLLDSATADQTLTTLIFAKEFGGREVTATLRMLSTFLREEFKTREEIDTRFGWVRNSAVLGAVAPWLLLALLSTQKSTIEAYQSSAGILILSIGVTCTAIAFIWMERVSRIPSPARPLKPADFSVNRSPHNSRISMSAQFDHESAEARDAELWVR